MPQNSAGFDSVLKDLQGRNKMSSVSKAQRRFFGGWEHSSESMRGKKPDMTKSQMSDFASTSEKGLPETAAKKSMKSVMRKRKK